MAIVLFFLLCRHGRTETIRPATSAAKTCAQLMQRSHSAGSEEMMAAVSEAINTHFELTRNAAMGEPLCLRLSPNAS